MKNLNTCRPQKIAQGHIMMMNIITLRLRENQPGEQTRPQAMKLRGQHISSTALIAMSRPQREPQTEGA
jgi:hypothetical protein